MGLRAENKKQVRFVGSGVGSGKTHYIINKEILQSIKSSPDLPHLYVVPTKVLGAEIRRDLLVSLGRERLENNIYLIDSDNLDDPRFTESSCYGNALSILSKKEHGTVCIVTTRLFEMLLLEAFSKNFLSSYHVILDEGIDPTEYIDACIDIDKVALLKELLARKDHDTWELDPAHFKTAKKVADNNVSNLPHHRGLSADEQIRKLLTKACSGVYDIRGTITDAGKVDLLVTLTAEIVKGFRKTTFVVANFLDTFQGKWLNENNVELIQIEDEALFDTHSLKGPMMEIGYLLHPLDNASKSNLEKEYEGRTVLSICQEAIMDFFSDDDHTFIYNMKNSYPDMPKGKRIPVVNAGLNEYRNFNNVAVLATVNAKPFLADLMAKVIGGDSKEVYKAYACSHAYQTIGRTSVRLRDRNSKIRVIVLNKMIADYLREKFAGAKDIGQITDLPYLEGINRKAGGAQRSQSVLLENGGRTFKEADVRKAWSRFSKTFVEKHGREPTQQEKFHWYDNSKYFEKYGVDDRYA